MTIRIEKCMSLGIKKSSYSSIQFFPTLLINQNLVPAVHNGHSFKYLGRFFTLCMDNYEHKFILLEALMSLLNKIDAIPCHPRIKLPLYHRFILSKLSWHLTIADLSRTWVVEDLDNVFTKYIRRWFELPNSASISCLIVNRSCYGLKYSMSNNYSEFFKIFS